MHSRLHPLTLAIGLTLAPAAWSATIELDSSLIRASALDTPAQQMTTPAAVLDGDALVLRREATLGDTLDSLPGVRASGFGAGASRPQIRGLDGARVRVMSDGVDVLDASTLSQDHAVSVEPLLTERIEVLRGPATLLYGGGAIGGVVNLIDKKVPTYVPANGYEGEVELRANSVANEGAGLLGLTVGQGNVALRVEGVKRQADDYELPDSSDKQLGAYNDTESYSLGGSFIGARGYLGLAYSRQENRYGLLAHEHVECDPHGDHWHCGDHGHGHDHDHDDHEHEDEAVPYITLRQNRWDLRGELNDPLPGFELARLRVGHSDYRHAEMEAGEAAAIFDNQASEARVELTHRPLFGWHGVLGGQTTRRDFQRWTAENPMPQTLTRNHALFLLEEYTAGAWRYELGSRYEWQDIDADAGAPDTEHSGVSLSAGVVWTFAPEYSLGVSLSRSQRLPSAEELYAYGPHAASRTIEKGNPQLEEETARNAEITLRKFAGATTFSLGLFHNQVADFIYAADLGRNPGGGYREVEYRQADALLTGFEGEIRHQFTEATALTLFGDRVRGRLKDGGDLPRIPADRLGLRLEQALGNGVSGDLSFQRVQRQDRLAEFETETAGYNLLAAGLSWQGALSEGDWLVYLKADNLLDVEARQHSSLIKDEVVLPGRNLTLGTRFTF
ncbi:TonB-dependent receptor [Pseudomonas flexibilis]|uniref:TonB-dependent receptor n=1 Tax=Pseudomonas flexibilis TaxID=706570 RepID=A0A0B3BVF9_9PSED|nr:TonB-dependent receptor [Pseudomonas flexibilis]KHO65056.1 TonB-dependent receptor [Pseudomonas flexibilis]SCY39785.1 iron complex outermembrane recepter protein [Pseudomonas flexibilis]